MKLQPLFVAAVAIGITGCDNDSTSVVAVPTPSPVKLTPAQELARYCRVCVKDQGKRMEEYLPSRLDTKLNGKTYKFCADSCKKAFDANPKRYALK
jgi:hypothetical protein